MAAKLNQTLAHSSSTIRGVMLNAYPDSIGKNLHHLVGTLQKPEFKDVFSLFYVLPTFFNSDLDRGFSIIDYDLNKDLVANKDLEDLKQLNITLKLDIVLNHLSVASPQFRNLLKYGDASKYKDFFINWNAFWAGNGKMGEDGVIIPRKKFLRKLFMRKSELPILKIHFPDGTEKPYWNTFYQEVKYHHIGIEDLNIDRLSYNEAQKLCNKVNNVLDQNQDIKALNFEGFSDYKDKIIQILEKNKTYLGQMDVNAQSPLVWEFYEETLKKLSGYGCKILRLDAFAYLHKAVGEVNFFNKPGTWHYLERINKMALKNNLLLLPEIHANYGAGLHDEVAQKGYYIYDFFLPGLMIHTLESNNNKALIHWASEIINKGYKIINMLGCHDGIPVLDLKGKEDENGIYHKGLLTDKEIESVLKTVIERGGRVKNLYNSEGKKISYYQVNATFFSALGEDKQKLLLARAIQMFMPGIPQVWYLDIFAGKNNYEAVVKGGKAGHKEINRTNLSMEDVSKGLKKAIVINQLKLMRLRNTANAFLGNLTIKDAPEDSVDMMWKKGPDFAHLKANLKTYNFTINYRDGAIAETLNF